MNTATKRSALAVAVAGICLGASLSQASSHREAPFITEVPKVDGTDFYMFRSYETGREDFVTLIANYLPLQDAYGGPNYFDLDENAIYEIHIDNDGDAVEDLTFQFDFETVNQDFTLNIDGTDVAIPLKTAAALGADASADANNPALQSRQTYSIDVIRGDRRTGTVQAVTDMSGGTNFSKPADNIGSKTISNYPTYAKSHVNDISIPGCGMGRVFVGQRQEAFAVNLGEIFDLVNLPLADVAGFNGRDLGLNILNDKNVTSLAIEVPTQCLTSGSEPVIGGWTSASLRQARVLNPEPTKFTDTDMGKGATVEGGAYTQVSRLGSPLVNEVVIGLRDKNKFNASEPKDDASNFAPYVLTPTLPALVEILFGEQADTAGFPGAADAPTAFPRADLIWAFLNGVPGLNRPSGNVVLSEMLRLNTTIAPTELTSQNDLGVIETDGMGTIVNPDFAGFPNGRRPVDDVVDIALRVAMGVLYADRFDAVHPDFETLMPGDATAKDTEFTDGAVTATGPLLTEFPYLGHPISGSPNPQRP
ncbi:DUF4331 domain-containing protein [Marinobacter sediminum]|uniref:DUF4331 domain-containing protein n=1 Tax=Marinobacter sediminum TaxID=256323 RepID=UPI0019399785|nr:DUF4331 domain-containing protein [Marinobacter sediminum]